MELIGVPLPPSVSFSPGYDDFPAYNFGPEANIGRLTKTFVPGSFYRDFAIIVTVTLESWTPLNLFHAVIKLFKRSPWLWLQWSTETKVAFIYYEVIDEYIRGDRGVM